MKSDSAPEFDAAFLNLLACPQCKGSLTLNAAMLTLDCSACRLRYRISDGIPVLLVDEAEAL